MADVLPTALGPVHGTVEVPGSKSIVNRALICAALADGESRIAPAAPGRDTQAMLECLVALGVPVGLEDRAIVVRGCAGHLRGGPTVSARLAGTTSRFITAVAALGTEATTVTGDAALRRRPIGPLVRALRSLGASVESLHPDEELPIQVRRADLHGGTVELPGDVSSQFLSALMMIGPLLDGGLDIIVTGRLVSVPYLHITASVMRAFGIDTVSVESSKIRVAPGRYRATDYIVEPDASSASYPLAAAAICGGEIHVPGLGPHSVQGDIGFIDVLGAMGCEVRHDASGVTVRGTGRLRGIAIDLQDMSDLVPTVAALSVFADSPTTITGVGFIRHKESDRIGDLAAGLRDLGCSVEETADGLRIEPADTLRGRAMATHHDHRLAMAWSLIALRVAGISVDDPSVVAKSWPEWWSTRDDLIASSRSEQG